MASLPKLTTTAFSTETPAAPMLVRVVDLDMPMRSMMNFMVKWAIASIPAMILLAFVGGILVVVLSSLIAIATLGH